MEHTVKLTINVDKTAWKQEMDDLSDKLGVGVLMYTPLSEVSEMVLKTANNPISIEINVAFRFKWIQQCWEIEKQLGFTKVMEFAEHYPTIDRVCNRICGEIYGYAHDMEKQDD